MATSVDDDVLEISEVNDTALQAAAKANTQLSVQSTTNFDVIGEYFKVKLSDANGKALTNTKLTFAVSGKSYSKTTDGNGIASLQLRLNDGTYTITTKFAGNTNYKASSISTTVTMTNTRVVDVGLSNSEIQKNNANNQVNDVSRSYETQSSAQEGASEASSGDAGNAGSELQSVVKQIIIDEDEFFKVTGITFIVLLMILTIGYYYRDDIKEMNSKR